MAVIIQIRRDLAANWTSANPILAQGEFGFETDTGQLKVGDGTTAWNALGYVVSAGGEANTASNQGAGVGVFDNKNVLDLEFRSLVAASSKVLITLDAGNKEIDIDVQQGNINHDALLNFDANEHVDHTTVNIDTPANSGLSGGGDISSTRTLLVDPNNATDEVITASDEILFADADDSNNLKKDTVQGLLDLIPPSANTLQDAYDNSGTPADIDLAVGKDLEINDNSSSLIARFIEATRSLGISQFVTWLTEIATPSTPATGVNLTYFKSDALQYRLRDDGKESLTSERNLDITSISYNGDGSINVITYDNGETDTYAYNADGSIDTITGSRWTTTVSYNGDGTISGVAYT